MNNTPQTQTTQPADPDMALLFLGSWFEKLLHAPEREDATLDAVAGHIILDERPKTLLGLVITALAEKWLRRRLWMLDFDSLPPSDQGVRVVIDAVLLMPRLAGDHQPRCLGFDVLGTKAGPRSLIREVVVSQWYSNSSTAAPYCGAS